MYIDKDNIKVTEKIIDTGGYARIHLCEYNNKLYAYKKFIEREFIFTDNDIKRIEVLTDKNIFPEIILPKYLIRNNGKFESYITDLFNGETFDSLYKKDIALKIEFLLKIKDVIIKMNNELDIIHGDIHPDNLMFNKDTKKVCLIDFDNCKIDNINQNKNYLNPLYKEYITYNSYSSLADIYMFNILTFSLLNEVNYFMVNDYIINNGYGDLFNSKSSFKLLDDISICKENKEFLIDMVDEKKLFLQKK